MSPSNSFSFFPTYFYILKNQSWLYKQTLIYDNNDRTILNNRYLCWNVRYVMDNPKTNLVQHPLETVLIYAMEVIRNILIL